MKSLTASAPIIHNAHSIVEYFNRIQRLRGNVWGEQALNRNPAAIEELRGAAAREGLVKLIGAVVGDFESIHAVDHGYCGQGSVVDARLNSPGLPSFVVIFS